MLKYNGCHDNNNYNQVITSEKFDNSFTKHNILFQSSGWGQIHDVVIVTCQSVLFNEIGRFSVSTI